MTQLQGKCLVNVVLENVGDNDNSQGNYCQDFCLFSRKLVRVMIIHKVTAVRVMLILKVTIVRGNINPQSNSGQGIAHSQGNCCQR